MSSKADKLAAWTRLSDSRFGDCYSTVKPWGKGDPWTVIVATAQVDNVDPKLQACRAAGEEEFLEQLALALANWEDRAGRSPQEIASMLDDFCGFGILQGMTDQQRGFMSADILMPLVRVSAASAIVYRGSPVPMQIGTAFLVKPDLVLTAAHVAMKVSDSVDQGSWAEELWPDLIFNFAPRPNDPNKNRVSVRSAVKKALVSFALPNAKPPNLLIKSIDPPAGEKLDFALIRLAQRVEHIDPVEIDDHASVKEGRPCWAFGFPGGNDLKMDVNKVARVERGAGRWRHFTNATAGMSGGCCVNDVGQVVGLHEGTLELTENEVTSRYNRGILMSAIRAAQRQGGVDPFTQRAATPGIEFQDALVVGELFQAGLQLIPKGQKASWKLQFQGAVGVNPANGNEVPSFHPWFTRAQYEDWIDSVDRFERLCLVHGARGAGTSFAVRILKAKLTDCAADLLALSATQTTAIGWEVCVAQGLASEDAAFRTTAAQAQYSDTDALITELRRRSGDRQRTRYVALDFGGPDRSFRFEGTPWFELVKALLINDWIKVVIIGLSEVDRIALADSLARGPLTSALKLRDCEMKHIGRQDLIDYAGQLAIARGKPLDAAALEVFVEDNFADFSGTLQQDVQTACAALSAIAFERGLHQ